MSLLIFSHFTLLILIDTARLKCVRDEWQANGGEKKNVQAINYAMRKKEAETTKETRTQQHCKLATASEKKCSQIEII